MTNCDFLKGLSKETTIRRDAAGRWYHDDVLIENPNIIRAFNRWIRKNQEGRYCLENQVNWVYISLEGPPIFVRSLKVTPSGRVLLFLSNEREEKLVPDTLRQDRDGALYCDVCGQNLVARFDNFSIVQLQEVVQEDELGVYLRFGDQMVRPPLVDDPLLPKENEA